MLLLGGVLLGDTLTLKDGRTFKGELVSQDENKVVFRIEQYGAKMIWTFKPSEVKSIQKAGEKVVVKQKDDPSQEPAGPSGKTASHAVKAAAKAPLPPGKYPPPPAVPAIKPVSGPSYYLVPLKGEVGRTLLASTLRGSLEDALKRRPTVVVLEVDSPGGRIDEVRPLAEVIQKYEDDLRIVVWARDALSAAAISSMACDEIYMSPTGRFGSARAIMISEGMVSDVDKKVQSVWRATARAIAPLGGYDPMLAQAMIDPEIQLHWKEEDGKVVIHEGKGPNMISRKGELLTLTSTEALACGLSDGTVSDLDDLAEKLKLEGWTRIEGYAEILAEYHQDVLKKFNKEIEEVHEQYVGWWLKAVQSDPLSYGGYQIWGAGRSKGKFTPRSRIIWQQRTTKCLRNLYQMEMALDRAAELIDELPKDLSETRQQWRKEMLEYSESLMELRRKINNNTNVQGPDDIKE